MKKEIMFVADISQTTMDSLDICREMLIQLKKLGFIQAVFLPDNIVMIGMAEEMGFNVSFCVDIRDFIIDLDSDRKKMKLHRLLDEPTNDLCRGIRNNTDAVLPVVMACLCGADLIIQPYTLNKLMTEGIKAWDYRDCIKFYTTLFELNEMKGEKDES